MFDLRSMSRAQIAALPDPMVLCDRITVGTWSGMPNYQCPCCPHASLDRSEVEQHLMSFHIAPALADRENSKPAEPSVAPRREITPHAGRRLFLAALNVYYPKLLESFRDRVGPILRELCAPGSKFVRMEMFSNPEYARLAAAINDWRNQHQILDEWIADAALYSLQRHFETPLLPFAWSIQEAPAEEFRYVPPPARTWYPDAPIFALELDQGGQIAKLAGRGNRVSPFGSLDQFKARMRTDFEQQLDEYVGRQKESHGCAQTEASKYAEWAARIMSGSSRLDIAGEHYDDPYEQVKTGVRRFTKIIGLTLPGSRSRRR